MQGKGYLFQHLHSAVRHDAICTTVPYVQTSCMFGMDTPACVWYATPCPRDGVAAQLRCITTRKAALHVACDTVFIHVFTNEVRLLALPDNKAAFKVGRQSELVSK